ncbi:hypothetical protein FACS1894133_1120 [Clostridia bacterium]|nr:hypothetical protein FACS1894133_1120 [Clostridia bacterium]
MRQINTQLLLKQAAEHIRYGRFDTADAVLNEIVTVRPKSAAVYYHKLLVEFTSRNEEELALIGAGVVSSVNFAKACRYAGLHGGDSSDGDVAVYRADGDAYAAVTAAGDDNGGTVFFGGGFDEFSRENGGFGSVGEVGAAADAGVVTGGVSRTVEEREIAAKLSLLEERINVMFPDLDLQMKHLVLPPERDEGSVQLAKPAAVPYATPVALYGTPAAPYATPAAPYGAPAAAPYATRQSSYGKLPVSYGAVTEVTPTDVASQIPPPAAIAATPHVHADSAEAMRRINAQRSEKYARSGVYVAQESAVAADTPLPPGTAVAEKFVPPPLPPPPRRLTFLEKMTHMPFGQAVTAVITVIVIAAVVIVNIPLHRGDFIASLKQASVSDKYPDATIGTLYDKYLTNAQYTQKGGTFFSKYIGGDPDLYITVTGKLDGYDYLIRFRLEYDSGGGADEHLSEIIGKGGYVPYIERVEFNGHILSEDDSDMFQKVLFAAYVSDAENAVEFLEDTFGFDPNNPAALLALLQLYTNAVGDSR